MWLGLHIKYAAHPALHPTAYTLRNAHPREAACAGAHSKHACRAPVAHT